MSPQPTDDVHVRPWLDEAPDAAPAPRRLRPGFRRAARHPQDGGPAARPRAGAAAAMRSSRRGLLWVAVVVTTFAAAGVTGYALSRLSGDGGRAVPPPGRSVTGPSVAGPIDQAGIRLTPPPGWTRLERAPRIPGVSIPGAIALRDRTLGVTAVAGMLPPTSATLLPDSLVRRLVLRPGIAEPVRVAPRLRGLHYQGLWITDPHRLLDVWVVPTTAGVATVACLLPSGAGASADCSQVAETLRVAPARALEPRDDTGFRMALPAAVRRLDDRRAVVRSALAGARSTADQVRLMTQLGQDHASAADELRRLVPPAREWPDRIVVALDATADAYESLAGALERGGSAAVASARQAVLAAEAQLDDALDLRQGT
jgi:hypothetical protein